MLDYIPLFGPIPGGPELIVILAVIVLLFGANRIPKLAHASGQAMGEFQRGREEVEQEIRAAASARNAADDVDDESESVSEDVDDDLVETATNRKAT